jgi:hypothetical protein
MRVASADGDVSIGELGATRDPDYKLDVQGILNADDIYKDGTQLVGSQWKDVSSGISYAAGNVGVGKAPGSGYRLDVAGAINASDYHKNGAPLSLSQWEEVAGGITYGGGAVGIGKAPSRSYKLDVAGTINATDVHKNGSALVGSQWTDVSGLGIRYNGLVGLGKEPSSAYKLDMAGPINATDYHRAGRPLIAAGRTPPGLEWQQYENNAGVFIDVNTEAYHFSTTPVYVTALHGTSKYWATTGGSSVYMPTPTASVCI